MILLVFQQSSMPFKPDNTLRLLPLKISNAIGSTDRIVPFDWIEVKTSDPDFYKWTQWIFLLLFDAYYCNTADKALPISNLVAHLAQKGTAALDAVCDSNTPELTAKEWEQLSEEAAAPFTALPFGLFGRNRSKLRPDLGTVLANDEIINGVSERVGIL